MITISTNEASQLTPSTYDDILAKLDFRSLSCPCGLSGGLSIHGYYIRHIKNYSNLLSFKICRVKCKYCNHTHAILLSSMVPYSQISLKDHILVIESLESNHPTSDILKNNSNLDESNLRYITRQYTIYWRNLVSSPNIAFTPSFSLISYCFSNYSRQFMQIKSTSNILEQFPHNLTRL